MTAEAGAIWCSLVLVLLWHEELVLLEEGGHPPGHGGPQPEAQHQGGGQLSPAARTGSGGRWPGGQGGALVIHSNCIKSGMKRALYQQMQSKFAQTVGLS